MGQVADRRNAGQAGAALEGVEVALQQLEGIRVAGIFAPGLQQGCGTVDQVPRFFQEDGGQFVVQFAVFVGGG